MSKIVVGELEGPSTTSNKITIASGSQLDIAGSPGGSAAINLAVDGSDITTGTIPSTVSFLGTGGGQVGQIICRGGTAVPTGFLYCDGSAVSRTTYSSLFAVLSENYGEGNGTTTFNVPDLRGLFARGQDDGSSNDPDDSTRTDGGITGANTGDNVGSYQADAIKEHLHTVPVLVSTASTSGVNPKGTNTGASWTTINSNNFGGNQTNPRNLYVRYYIKY